MRTPIEHRQAFIDTLNHVQAAFGRIRDNAGNGRILTFPDQHKLTEGLFLSAWTYWEGFCQDVLVADLATDANGKLRVEIKKFRTKKASLRLSERMLNHPDHPKKFVDWADYQTVQDRANEFLGAGHRFIALPRNDDLTKLKRIRNAVAHRSDKAWESFRSVVTGAPFNLSGNQLRGITPGRFLSSHQWNGNRVLDEAAILLEACAVFSWCHELPRNRTKGSEAQQLCLSYFGVGFTLSDVELTISSRLFAKEETHVSQSLDGRKFS